MRRLDGLGLVFRPGAPGFDDDRFEVRRTDRIDRRLPPPFRAEPLDAGVFVSAQCGIEQHAPDLLDKLGWNHRAPS